MLIDPENPDDMFSIGERNKMEPRQMELPFLAQDEYCKNCRYPRAGHSIGKPAYCYPFTGKFFEPGGMPITLKEHLEEHAPITSFESGAKSSGNLPPYECLTPSFLRRAARRMEKGLHYGKHNWKKGATDKKFILERLGHAVEHLWKVMEEIDNDVTAYDDDDLAAVVVNCMFAMHYQKTMNSEKHMVTEE